MLTAVRDEPIIQIGPYAEEESDEDMEISGERGDLMIRGLKHRSTDCIIDVRVINAEAKSYRNKDVDKIIEAAEKSKRAKYGKLCDNNRKDFEPVVCTADGVVGPEGSKLLKLIVKRLAKKWRRDYSDTCGFVRSRIGVALARDTHRCFRGSRIPITRMSSPFVQWEDGVGLGLYTYIDDGRVKAMK